MQTESTLQLRVNVAQFSPRETHRRLLRKNSTLIDIDCGPVQYTDDRVYLYMMHRMGRGFDSPPYSDFDEYAVRYQYWVSKCPFTSFEIRYYVSGDLVGVAVMNTLNASMMEAYMCYYDPAYSHLSIGTYSILIELALCKAAGVEYLSLGDYKEKFLYKTSFYPYEVGYVEGRVWRPSDDD